MTVQTFTAVIHKRTILMLQIVMRLVLLVREILLKKLSLI
jgi:hypothetical protein